MKPFLIFLITISLSFFVNGQNINLTGTVYDPNGAVIVGAKINAVHEKGLAAAGASNNEGEFKISAIPGVYAIEVSAQGFLTVMYNEYLVVNSTYGKMTLDFVLFVDRYQEPCPYFGACPPAKRRLRSYKIEYLPKLKKIRDVYAPDTKPKIKKKINKYK